MFLTDFLTELLIKGMNYTPALIGIAVLIFMGAAGLMLCIPFYVYLQQLQNKLQEATQQKIILQKIMNIYNEGLSWWHPHAEYINYSRSFSQLFDLKSDQPVTLADIANHFSIEDGQKLSQDLQKLTHSRLPFQRHLRSIHHNQTICFRGSFLPLEKNGVAVLFAETIAIPSLEERLQNACEERDRLQLMLDSVPVAVWYRDENIRITLCNSVYAGLAETTPQEVIQKGQEWIKQERQNSPYNLAIKAKTTRLAQSQQIHIVVAGLRRLVEITELPLEEQNSSVGFAVDMTEIEETRAELAKHIAAYQEILQMLSTPVAVYRPDTTLQFFNQAYQKLFGFDEAWLYNKPTLGEILEDLRERRKLPEQQNFPAYKKECLALFNNLLQPQEIMMHQPDGLILRALIAPYPLGGLFYLFDNVTDKLTLEQSFNTLIAVQKETIDHLHEGIAVLGSDFRLRLANNSFEKLWNLQGVSNQYPEPHVSELLMQAKGFVRDNTDIERVKDQLFSLLNERLPFQSRLHCTDGRIIQFTYVPLPDGSHLLSFVDISDVIRFEQALQERNEALEQAAQLKSDFISSVSYELRAPLNTILGFTEMLTNQYFGVLNERQLDYCHNILESSQRLLRLINDMIDMANIEAGQLTLAQHPIHLESFLNSTIGLIFHRANDRGLEVTSKNLTNINYFVGDERRLKQALYNLLINSVKHTPSNGKICLEAFLSGDHKYLHFKIQDTGIGIPRERQKRIFELFEHGPSSRFQKKQRGVGLGLPLVKSLIELHGGVVKVESQPNVGTTITCALPLVTPPTTLQVVTGTAT